MPFNDISADQISGGAFADAYTISGAFTVGNTATAHVVIGSDVHGANGVRLYGADGITPLIDLNIASPFVAGSVVSGPVASATNATTATNLAGGGTAAGSTTIAGALVVGNPATAHVVVGTDTHGADGVRLYASDGVTALIDLNIAGTPTITAALIRTAASGKRVEMSGTAADRLDFFSGDPNESSAGLLAISNPTQAGATFTRLDMAPARLAGVHAPTLVMIGGSQSGSVPPQARIQDETGHTWFNVDQTQGTGALSWDGVFLNTPGNLELAGAAYNSFGVAHLEIVNTAGDLATGGVMLQAITGQTGDLLQTRSAAGTPVARLLPSGEYRSINAITIGDGTTVQTRIFGIGAAPGAGLGSGGDFAFRWNGVAGQRIYYNNAGVWVGIV